MNWEAIFWLAAMVVFIITELLTVSLVSIWFVAGALGAIVVVLFGGSLMVQITVFLAVAIMLLICLRGVVRRHFTPGIVKTNLDSIIGARGMVVTPVNNIAALGQVQINGLEWSARSTNGSHIPAGTVVRVDSIEGVKVFVSVAEDFTAV